MAEISNFNSYNTFYDVEISLKKSRKTQKKIVYAPRFRRTLGFFFLI